MRLLMSSFPTEGLRLVFLIVLRPVSLNTASISFSGDNNRTVSPYFFSRIAFYSRINSYFSDYSTFLTLNLGIDALFLNFGELFLLPFDRLRFDKLFLDRLVLRPLPLGDLVIVLFAGLWVRLIDDSMNLAISDLFEWLSELPDLVCDTLIFKSTDFFVVF